MEKEGFILGHSCRAQSVLGGAGGSWFHYAEPSADTQLSALLKSAHGDDATQISSESLHLSSPLRHPQSFVS